jgi:hypothetical protein
MNQDLYSFIENHSIIEIKEMLNSTIENCTLNDLNQNKITQKNIIRCWCGKNGVWKVKNGNKIITTYLSLEKSKKGIE